MCLICLASASIGCSKAPADLSNLEDFVKHSYPVQSQALTDTVDLFIDYSSCVAQAKNSNWYNATHPSIVDCSPTFYSIKGNKIKKETSDRQQVYQLLNTITEVNNADIKSAVNMIVNSNHQAVLITDGEYFLSNASRDNLNNPYLAEEFRTWLTKGYDIYIYSEPYLENGRYEKFRYYMFFTDTKIKDNVYEKFARTVPADARVKLLHLNNGVPDITFAEDYPNINQALSPNPETTRHNSVMDVQEYLLSWSDMNSYLKTGSINEDYIFRGLFVNNRDENSYKINKVDAVVYQIYDQYTEFCDSLALEGNLPAAVPVSKLKKVKNVFKVNDGIFEETGEIVLELSKNFDGIGDRLSDEHPNLLRVDFVVSEAKDNFSGNDGLNSSFKWMSMSRMHQNMLNTSIYQSISQTISDPKMNPATEKSVIYTVYINTASI